ncbi:MAG: lamin tail domain-containing protein [Bacteroidetes bacterium]|nr:lamin tail domain-containing protein [Bacteroidota bacterium]
MIRNLLTSLTLSLLICFTGHSQSAMFTRVATARGDGNGNDFSKSIVSDPNGNLYITGKFESTCHFGNDSVTNSGSGNMFLAKYNPSKGFLRAVAPIVTGIAEGDAIAYDVQGSLYVTGLFGGNINFGYGFSFSSSYFNTFIARYDTSGNLIWARSISGDNNNPVSITTDNEGNIYVAGHFEGDLTYDGLSINSFNGACYLLKIGRDGQGKWISHSGGSGTVSPKSVCVNPSGSIVLVGTFYGSVTFGTINIDSFGASDVFLCSLNPSGNFNWAVNAGGSGYDEGSSVVCGSDGSVFINGTYEESASFGSFILNTGQGYESYAAFVAKTDAGGNFLWAKSLAIPCRSNNLMSIDSKNNIYLTSSFWGSIEIGPSVLWSNGYGDVYVIKMDKDGQALWAKGGGSNYVDDGLGITLLPAGNVAVTGILSAGATLDSIAVTSLSSNIFIATLDQIGKIAIDEINCQSSDSLNTGDWVEIRNTGSKPVDLTGWTLKDGNDNNEFVIDSSTTLDPGQFLVFCQDKQKFSHFNPDVLNVTGSFTFDLASNGEKVRLYNTDGLLMAQVRYFAVSPWPVLAFGTSRTIELINYQGELSDGNNWITGCPGGSPGRRYQECDSVGIETIHPAVHSYSVYPNPSSACFFLQAEYPVSNIILENSLGRKLEGTVIGNDMNYMVKTGVLPDGIYFLTFTMNGNSCFEKVVIQNH